MFVKLQNLDVHCFYVLGSTKTLPTSVGVSVSPPEKVVSVPKKREEVKILDNHGGQFKKLPGVLWHTRNRRSGNGISQPCVKKQSSATTVDREHGKEASGDNGTVVQEDNGATVLPSKVHAKCLKKCYSYGGCIPDILLALDEVEDLDMALRPWEETLSNKERSIILKEQTSWVRALEIFDWFKRKGCYELNVIHYNIMLRILGKAQKWSQVECLWDEMKAKGIEPINSTYGTLIDVYGKGGHKEEALIWLERMNEHGVEPDEITMGIVIQLYKKAGEYEKADGFFKKWSSDGSLNFKNCVKKATTKVESDPRNHLSLSPHTYNTLIDTYGKAGQLHEASKTFAKMLEEGVAPTTVTFNTMIHICGNHGHFKEVASLLQKMEELRCPSDTRTYNILISIYAKLDDIDMATSYFRKMMKASLQPDIVSYRTLLYAYSIRLMVPEAEQLVSEMDERGLVIDEFTQSALTRMYIEAGMLEKSWLWFMRFHLAGTMSSECYSANMDAYGERGQILEAERVFSCCKEENKLTVLEFNVLIKAYGVVKYCEKACQLFDIMESNGVLPDKCSYISLIQILASADKPQMANSFLRKMQAAGLVTDCVPYSVVISGFAKLGLLDLAEGLYKEMIVFGLQPDVIVYGVLINAFAESGSVEKVSSYFEEMKSAGLPGNTIIYNSLIKVYTKVGFFEEARETYKLLQSLEDGPTAYSSNCMMDIYSERSMVKEAGKIFESLKDKGEANEFTYAMMLCMHKKLGRLDKAIQIARQMRELGLLRDLLSYNNVIGLYVMDGRFKEAVSIFKEMIEAGIQPDDCTFKSFGVALLKRGVSKQAVTKLEVAAKRDVQSSLPEWMSVLSLVVGVHGYDNA